MKKTIQINTPFIRLDAALKLAGVAATGGHAKAMVQGGQVLVNGQVCTQRGRKLTAGTVFSVAGEPAEYEVTAES